MFSSYKTWKGKNKDFARQNKFFAMPMPMPTSTPMLMPRYGCRDFQMAIEIINRASITDRVNCKYLSITAVYKTSAYNLKCFFYGV